MMMSSKEGFKSKVKTELTQWIQIYNGFDSAFTLSPSLPHFECSAQEKDAENKLK